MHTATGIVTGSHRVPFSPDTPGIKSFAMHRALCVIFDFKTLNTFASYSISHNAAKINQKKQHYLSKNETIALSKSRLGVVGVSV